MSGTGRRPAGVCALLLVVALLVTACGLRTPSGVRVDQRSVDTAADEPDIRKLPPGPVSGGSPTQIVDGFLEASAADPDHSFALDFLAAGATWTDRDAATIYEPDSVTPMKLTTSGSTGTVKFAALGLGTISSGGAFLPSERLLSLSFGLRKVAGQWRLSYVPPGVLLTSRDLTRSYRPVRTYGFSPDGSLLVAEPGYVVSDRAGLASAALHALLTGWGSSTAAVAGGLPPGLNALGSVVVRDGVATVDLSREAFTVPQSRRSRVVAQIAASLASVPGVFTVRVLVEERPYAGGPVDARIPDDLDPTSQGPALAVSAAGGLLSVDGTRTQPVRWAKVAGASGPGPVVNAVSAPGGKRLAAVRLTAQGDQLLLADLDDNNGAPPTTATVRHVEPAVGIPGVTYLPAQWLNATRLLLAVGGSSPRLQLVDASNGIAYPVYSPNLAALGPLSSFVVSRDGTRAIAVAGPVGARRVYLARVTSPSAQSGSTDRLMVDGWTQVPTALPDVATASWSGDLAVTIVGTAVANAREPSGGLRAEVVSLDGVPDPTVLPALPSAIAAQAAAFGGTLSVATAPGYPDLISNGTQAWAQQGAQWTAIGDWRAPAYP
ncbi:MAG: hypothetical protein JWN96_1678 [Mycobacterium sp.]|nr:hypothetical protein [Mycobacterium sp.]